MSKLAILKSRLRRLNHTIPSGYAATVTTLDGEPAIQIRETHTRARS